MVRAVGWLHRNALAYWFCGLGLLGLLRACIKLVRDPSFDAQLWLWFAGSTLLAAIGIAMLLRDRCRRRSIDTEAPANP
jgi:hypothetical protein